MDVVATLRQALDKNEREARAIKEAIELLSRRGGTATTAQPKIRYVNNRLAQACHDALEVGKYGTVRQIQEYVKRTHPEIKSGTYPTNVANAVRACVDVNKAGMLVDAFAKRPTVYWIGDPTDRLFRIKGDWCEESHP